MNNPDNSKFLVKNNFDELKIFTNYMPHNNIDAVLRRFAIRKTKYLLQLEKKKRRS